MDSKYNFEQIAENILEGIKFSDVAKEAGISTRTLLRIRQTDEFQAVLKAHKKQSFESALGKASYLSNVAINELKNIITDKDSNAQSKIQACKVILELAKNNYETENIAQRIEQLEVQLRG